MFCRIGNGFTPKSPINRKSTTKLKSALQRLISICINKLSRIKNNTCRLWQLPATTFAKVIYLCINILTSYFCQIAEIWHFLCFGEKTYNFKKHRKRGILTSAGRGKHPSKHSFRGRSAGWSRPNGNLCERGGRVSFAGCGRKACVPSLPLDFLYIQQPGR